jgi:hypothetical protein
MHSESAGSGGAGFFLHAQNYFWQQPPKQPLAQMKMTADLAASHLIDFIVFLLLR